MTVLCVNLTKNVMRFSRLRLNWLVNSFSSEFEIRSKFSFDAVQVMERVLKNLEFTLFSSQQGSPKAREAKQANLLNFHLK